MTVKRVAEVVAPHAVTIAAVARVDVDPADADLVVPADADLVVPADADLVVRDGDLVVQAVRDGDLVVQAVRDGDLVVLVATNLARRN
jgi:hypothetical protein